MLVKSVALFHQVQISETVLINKSFNELGIFNNFCIHVNICVYFLITFVPVNTPVCNVNQIVNCCNVLHSCK
jgi:hypothetical protein